MLRSLDLYVYKWEANTFLDRRAIKITNLWFERFFQMVLLSCFFLQFRQLPIGTRLANCKLCLPLLCFFHTLLGYELLESLILPAYLAYTKCSVNACEWM